MTGVFQAKKDRDGGSKELMNRNSKVIVLVNDPVSYSTDGTIIKYVSGEEIFGINTTQIVAPEMYDQVQIDNIATTPLALLIEPVDHKTFIEVLPATAITDEAVATTYIGTKVDFNVSLEAVMAVAGLDAEVVDYNLYNNADGTVNINPIVRMLITAN